MVRASPALRDDVVRIFGEDVRTFFETLLLETSPSDQNGTFGIELGYSRNLHALDGLRIQIIITRIGIRQDAEDVRFEFLRKREGVETVQPGNRMVRQVRPEKAIAGGKDFPGYRNGRFDGNGHRRTDPVRRCSGRNGTMVFGTFLGIGKNEGRHGSERKNCGLWTDSLIANEIHLSNFTKNAHSHLTLRIFRIRCRHSSARTESASENRSRKGLQVRPFPAKAPKGPLEYLRTENVPPGRSSGSTNAREHEAISLPSFFHAVYGISF